MARLPQFREPPKIFLSYAREDVDVADSLRSALANEGADVWTPEQLNLYTGDVTEKIRTLIGESIAVIADVSDARANVMYETGFAHALQRPCVHICSTPLDGLPFDIRNWNTMSYEKGATWKLREQLEERLRGVVQL